MTCGHDHHYRCRHCAGCLPCAHGLLERPAWGRPEPTERSQWWWRCPGTRAEFMAVPDIVEGGV